ncbi:MAG TPA: WD40 repeat domain-containing protein, partial [Gemmataceae bacterium]|nr:WD40 repeat domain-containing protein [Gemmataceae bacterium]
PDGQWVASTGQVLSVWNVLTGKLAHDPDGHVRPINGLAISPRSDWIATYDDREVHLWDPQTGKHKLLVDTGGTYVRVAAVSPDGKWLAAAHPGPGAGFLKVWATGSGRLVYNLPAHSQRGYGRFAEVRFSHDSRSLFSWGDDGNLRKWDLPTGKAVLEVLTEDAPKDTRMGALGLDRLTHYSWSTDGERFMVLGSEGDLRSFDANTGKEGPLLKLVGAKSRNVFNIALSSMHIAIGGFDPALYVHDLKSGKLAFQLSLPDRPQKYAFSPDGKTLIVATASSIMVFEVATRKVRMTFPAALQALSFCPDNRFLATAMNDSTALVWDLAVLAEGKKN